MNIDDLQKKINEETPSLFSDDDKKEKKDNDSDEKVVPSKDEVDMETAIDTIFKQTKDSDDQETIWRLGRKIAMATQTPIDKDVEEKVKKWKEENPQKLVSTGGKKEEKPEKEPQPEKKNDDKEDDSLLGGLDGVGTEEK